MTTTGTQTRFFRSTLGVFQGGGCRAAAFAGAYDIAVRRGARFTEVAGSSAGAIVGVLVGAGATPEQLLKYVTSLDYKQFLKPAEPLGPRSLWGHMAKYGALRKLASVYYDLGLHSSKYIEEWMEARLQELLPGEVHPIPFKALPLPTWVVAADAKGERVRVWSSVDTPDDSVATAVRASCAIPIFFQPVDRRYFDGGVLSNLPTFVFSRHESSDRPLSSRVLAFTLKSTTQQSDEVHPLVKLVNTVVDGSQEIQLRIQGRIPVLSIPTGDIRATDFSRMSPELVTGLVDNGRAAATKFFDAELGEANDPIGGYRICHGNEEYLDAVLRDAERASEVLISESDTDFAYALFPTLLYWRLRDTPVRILLNRHENASHAPYRRALLKLMGIEVIEVDRIPTRAYIINASSITNARAVVAVPSSSTFGKIAGVVYEGAIDYSAIQALNHVIEATLDGARGSASSLVNCPIRFEDARPTSIEKALRRVSQYSGDRIQIDLREVPLNRLVSLTRFVREYKYRQIETLETVYAKLGLAAFGPAVVRLSDGSQGTFVTPPVVEQNGDEFILIEGTTRATFLRDRGARALLCFVVQGVSDPLPAERVPFGRVRVVSKTLAPNDRYPGFAYSRFRHIESTVRPPNSLTPPP